MSLKNDATKARQTADSATNKTSLEEIAVSLEKAVTKQEAEVEKLRLKAENAFKLYSEFKTNLETMNSGIDNLYGANDE